MVADTIGKTIHKNEGDKMTIKELRTQSGMTQQAFADYFGVSKRAVESWEGGQRQCPDYLLNLMKYKLEKERIIENEEFKTN